ncbi:MAG: hypothetical protein KKF20_00495 [Bacteroidetes bacterium]|nr:hypothetical protein [Bacteroidota bacterium]MBU2470873.1 hypothetical protein [Bacteroidota bacterium]
MNRKLISLLIIVIIIVTAVLSFNCETGVEDSPTPGIIRVKLQADLSDTVLVERSDTFAVNLKYPAIFMIKIFQGRVFQKQSFAVLYRTKTSYRQEDALYNILELDSTGKYKEYIIFESSVPPGNYDRLEFGVTASKDDKLKIVALSGKMFENSVELPPGEKLLVEFPQDFNISENHVTQINVQLSPFKSIKRYRDVYHFYRQMKITGVYYF